MHGRPPCSEAPGTSKDRLADDTDLYAWVSPDAPNKVTIVGDWVPLLEPNGGPNFYSFDDDASYYMNIDNVGDATAHIRYEFTFRHTRLNPATFLYNTGVVRSISDPTLNVRQTYTITRWDDGVPTVLGRSRGRRSKSFPMDRKCSSGRAMIRSSSISPPSSTCSPFARCPATRARAWTAWADTTS